MKKILDLVYDSNYPNTDLVDLYLPSGSSYPIFIYFHGGSLEAGSRKDSAFIELVNKYNIGLAVADYNTYPNASYPDYINDAAKCVSFIKNYKETKDLKIFIGGSSAGAYLAMMLCFASDFLNKEKIKINDIAGFIFDAGQPTTHFNVLRERGLDSKLVRIDEAAPIYYIDEKVSDYPPMLISYAEFDMEGRKEQLDLLIATLKSFSYPTSKIKIHYFKGYKHCEYVGNSSFLEMINDFIRVNYDG